MSQLVSQHSFPQWCCLIGLSVMPQEVGQHSLFLHWCCLLGLSVMPQIVSQHPFFLIDVAYLDFLWCLRWWIGTLPSFIDVAYLGFLWCFSLWVITPSSLIDVAWDFYDASASELALLLSLILLTWLLHNLIGCESAPIFPLSKYLMWVPCDAAVCECQLLSVSHIIILPKLLFLILSLWLHYSTNPRGWVWK